MSAASAWAQSGDPVCPPPAAEPGVSAALPTQVPGSRAATSTLQKQLSQQLLQAVDDEKAGTVRSLLARGADANARDLHCVTALMLAAEDEGSEIAQALLQAHAEVNARDVIGWTALLTAAEAGNAEMIRLLLAHGAVVNEPDNDGWTPLIVASRSGKPEAVAALLAAGGDLAVADKNGTSPLMLAAAEGDTGILQVMLDNLSARARASLTAHSATSSVATSNSANPGETAEVSGRAGSEILNAADHAGWTALQHAASRGQSQAVRLLLDAGARADLQNRFGWTALMLAAENGDLPTADVLAAAPVASAPVASAPPPTSGGASGGNSGLEAADTQGTTALYLAASRGDAAMARLLLSHHANPNSRRSDGRTPLMAACERGSLEVVEALVAAGADVNAATPTGETALALAAHHSNNGPLVELLKRAGAK